MRILFTCSGPWGTGSFTYVEGLAHALRELGHEVLIFFSDNGIETPDAKPYFSNTKHFHIWKFPIKKEGICIERFPLVVSDPHPRNPDGEVFAKLQDTELNFYLETFGMELDKLFQTFKPDVIECQHIWAMASVAAKKECPYFCTAHNIDQIAYTEDPRMRPYADLATQKAKKIFSLSQYVKKEVVELYDIEEEKVIVTGSGYNEEYYHTQNVDKEALFKRLNIQIPEDAFLITFAGKISRTKGMDILLKANKLLGKDSNVHFLVCGAGNTLDILDEQEKEEVLFDRVHLLGHRSPKTLGLLHNIAYCSVMPSRTEGFGISCLEANACGIPVIYTRCGGTEEFAVGISVERGSPEDLARVIREIQNLSQEEMEKLKRKAAKRASMFSWKAIAAQRLEYYK